MLQEDLGNLGRSNGNFGLQIVVSSFHQVRLLIFSGHGPNLILMQMLQAGTHIEIFSIEILEHHLSLSNSTLNQSVCVAVSFFMMTFFVVIILPRILKMYVNVLMGMYRKLYATEIQMSCLFQNIVYSLQPKSC